MRMKDLTKEEQFLFNQSMDYMDGMYNESASLLVDDVGKKGSRSSAFYALGLLMRNQNSDNERAFKVMEAVINTQLDYPNEVFHGTFKTHSDAPTPPINAMPIHAFTEGWYEYMDRTLEFIGLELKKLSPNEPQIEDKLKLATAKVLPIVWDTYDPNWREFIASCFAIVIEEYQNIIPKNLLQMLDSSMKKAVEGSIYRRITNEIPMNTNVEIMHIFIAEYFGNRYERKDWVDHAIVTANIFYMDYQKNHSIAEFNSPTYCGVDVVGLRMWKKYCKTIELSKMGKELEEGLWEDLGLFYNKNLHAQSGPYSRNYDMQLNTHSSLGDILYLTLGEDIIPKPTKNSETSHIPLIIALGCKIPEKVREAFAEFTGKRLVTKLFNELIERGKKDERNPLCTATAWIDEYFMMGALSGSKNTSGQLHPATIFWGDGNGKVGSIRLLRREKNSKNCAHIRTIIFDGKVTENEMIMDINFATDRDIELFFEIEYDAVEINNLNDNIWEFPGLSLEVQSSHKINRIDKTERGAEIIYLHTPAEKNTEHMQIRIKKL